jgi:hypothetical protein
MRRLSPRRQGDIGEFSPMEWLWNHGYVVWLPVGHSPDSDVIAEDTDGRLLRVQVKTTTVWSNDRWRVSICTRGGNRSWNGVIKRFSADRCDRLFVLVGDGRRWFIPTSEVDGGTTVCLGGPKYAEFEVDSGRRLPSIGD